MTKASNRIRARIDELERVELYKLRRECKDQLETIMCLEKKLEEACAKGRYVVSQRDCLDVEIVKKNLKIKIFEGIIKGNYPLTTSRPPAILGE